MEYSKEFKAAVSAFSPKEKDKLIFRLLKKDRILSHRLYFELIDPETVDEKREQMQELVRTEVSAAAARYGRTKYFLPAIRRVSAKVTEHVKITTDKFGEVSLNLLLVAETLQHLRRHADHHKLYLYLLNKIFRTLVLTQKLDTDYYLELKEPYSMLNQLIIKDSDFAALAAHHQLNLDWFDPYNIPEHMDLVLREIKASGLLR